MRRRSFWLSSVLTIAMLWVVPMWVQADTLKLNYALDRPRSALVTVSLDNPQPVGAVAIVLEYRPDQLTINPESITGTGRTVDWLVKAHTPEERPGELRIAVMNFWGGSLEPAVGPIVRIPVQVDRARPTPIQFKVDGYGETAVFLETGEAVPQEELETMDTTLRPGAPGEPGALKVVPFKTRVRVGLTRQFHVIGTPGSYIWSIFASSAEDIGSIDAEGVFTAQAGGWVILAAEDEARRLIASSDTVVVMGGPTKILQRRGGEVFSADDTLVVAHFPPYASERAMRVLIEKQDIAHLPQKAKGQARAVAVFACMATDEETGEDIGKKGFKKKVRMTLHYADGDVPEGVEEEDLAVATFDEDEEQWEEVPERDVVEVDREANTMTVEVNHFSLWAIVDRTSLLETAVEVTTWGQIKSLLK